MLIANMVVHNEADRYLKEVLEHTLKFADVIVVTDDASTDASVDVASSFGDRVQVQQLPEQLFTKNESALRSASWKFLEEFATAEKDWILAVDADELLWGFSNLNQLMNQNRYHVLGIPFYHIWKPGYYRNDKLWVPNISSRLFRYYNGGEFLKRNLACGSEPKYVQELIRQDKMMWQTPLVFEHLGYMRDEDKRAKYERYAELDGGKFHAGSHIESIMDPHPTLVPFRRFV